MHIENSTAAIILLNAVCLFNVLSITTVISLFISVHALSESPQLQIDSQPILFRLSIVQAQSIYLYSKYLFNAALTCKDFLEEALDKIWEEILSLKPLLKLFPTLQIEDGVYVLNGEVSQADCDRLHYYSRRVKSIHIIYTDDHTIHPSTYIRIVELHPSALFPSLRHLHCHLSEIPSSHIFLFQSPLLDSLELYNIGSVENGIVGQFLATLSSSAQSLSRIALRRGRISVDILKSSIVHFEHLRYLHLSVAVFMRDFTLWEVLGSLPFLDSLTLEATDPASHPVQAPGNSNRLSGGTQYFYALRSLMVTGSFFFIHHLLDFIDSPCLGLIKIYPIIDNGGDHGPDNLFTPSMTIVASKWSQSLKILHINSTFSSGTAHLYAIPKSLRLLKGFPKMIGFFLKGWRMENADDDVKDLVTWWPKLSCLVLPRVGPATISLSTLRIIAESCPDLRHMHILLDTSSIPPFDTSSKSLGHKLESLLVGESFTQTSLECQIRMARYLDLIFPNMELSCDSGDVTWSGICNLIKLCQDVRRSQ